MTDQHVTLRLKQNDKRLQGTPSPEDGAGGSRRLSQRQLEKAPESRGLYAVVDGAPATAAPADSEAEADGAGPIEDGNVGAVGGDSRFHESL